MRGRGEGGREGGEMRGWGGGVYEDGRRWSVGGEERMGGMGGWSVARLDRLVFARARGGAEWSEGKGKGEGKDESGTRRDLTSPHKDAIRSRHTKSIIAHTRCNLLYSHSRYCLLLRFGARAAMGILNQLKSGLVLERLGVKIDPPHRHSMGLTRVAARCGS